MMNDFEIQWLKKLATGLKSIAREELFADVFVKRKEMSALEWTKYLMNELKEELKQEEIADVMTACACLYPNENLNYLRNEYARNGDLKAVHAMLQKQFEVFIKEYKKLEDQEVDFLLKNGWGMAGILEDDRIVATKIPKQYHEYFSTEDKREKAFYYCHCPRVREALRVSEKPLDMNYCYCGAGFYKSIWEYILQKSVRVEVLKSVMNDDEVCSIAIYFNEQE
jgi:hypothetical protein